MKITITFKGRYRETDCTFCEKRIHTASPSLPTSVSELIGKSLFWAHRHTAAHKANRPKPGLAPALEIDPEALERRRTGGIQ